LDRFQSFSEFWPYYLDEHKNTLCRILHFIGTSIYFGILVACFVATPIAVGIAILCCVILGVLSWRFESEKPAFGAILAMIVFMVVANPWVLSGVYVAYLFAWVGHFFVEKNRPATFTYPYWSLVADFRLWSLMCTGKFWKNTSKKYSQSP